MFSDLAQSWKFFIKTLPILKLRLGLYSCAGLLLLGYGSVILFFISPLHLSFNLILFILVSLLVGYLIYMALQELLLHSVNLLQMTIVNEVLSGHPVPEGKNQIDFARKVVLMRFKKRAELFLVESRMSHLFRCVGIKDRCSRIWKGHYWEVMLRFSSFLTIISLLSWVCFFVILIPPLRGMIMLFSEVHLHLLLITFILSWILKSVFIDAYLLVAMTIVYHRFKTGTAPMKIEKDYEIFAT